MSLRFVCRSISLRPIIFRRVDSLSRWHTTQNDLSVFKFKIKVYCYHKVIGLSNAYFFRNQYLLIFLWPNVALQWLDAEMHLILSAFTRWRHLVRDTGSIRTSPAYIVVVLWLYKVYFLKWNLHWKSNWTECQQKWSVLLFTFSDGVLIFSSVVISDQKLK